MTNFDGFETECCTEMDEAEEKLSEPEYFVMSEHARRSFEKMESYFLKEELTDIVIIAGKRRIHAHKLVLCAGSDYFNAMFTNNLKESSQKEIEILNVDGDALWALVHYCYTGKIDLFQDTIETVFVTASLLQLREVVEACCFFLQKQLHPSNCIGIRSFANSHECLELFEASQSYLSEYFLQVVKHKEFLMLTADEIGNLLASDDINVPSEEDIFYALMTWVEHDFSSRSESISKLLGLVKLPLLSPSFIVDHIESNPLFRDNYGSLETLSLIIEAFKYHLLPERRSLLRSPRTCPRKSTTGLLYALGGMDNTDVCVEIYDMRLNKWSTCEDLSFNRLQYGVVFFDGDIYIVGGRNGLKTLNDFLCYNVKTGRRKDLPSMATPRQGLDVAVLGGPLYAVGGHDGWSFLETVEKWDPKAQTWCFVASMSRQRSSLGVAVLNGKLYAVGGRDTSRSLASVECYDPYFNSWTPCASMNRPRSGLGVGVLNGYLYVLGGHEVPAVYTQTERFTIVERYDPDENTWSILASLSDGRDGIGVCVLGEKLFAVGGYNGNSYLSLVEKYDQYKNEWEEVASLNYERAGPCVVVTSTS